MSGLSRTPGKRVWVYPHRGFESRPLRQNQVSQRPIKTSVTTRKPRHHGAFCVSKPFFLLADECLGRMSAQETAFAGDQVF